MRILRIGLTIIISFAVIGVTLRATLGVPSVDRRLLGGVRLDLRSEQPKPAKSAIASSGPSDSYVPRQMSLGTEGVNAAFNAQPWDLNAPLEVISERYYRIDQRRAEIVDSRLSGASVSDDTRISLLFLKATFLNSAGETGRSLKVLDRLRELVEADEKRAAKLLGTTIFSQGVTAMRLGENENCIMCRGESSCILPISPAAIHSNPRGSRLAIKHFREYLERFPEDLSARWLLNLAHMTLGEYPDKVDPRFRLDLKQFFHSEFDIGRFRDVGHLVGVNRFNQAGGATMDDFDNDGLLDLVVTSFDSTQPTSYYHNQGGSTFEDQSEKAGVITQLGGLVCYQTDFDNDGWKDIYIARGAWLPHPVRPTLLRNNRSGGFSDVTTEAGLFDPVNSNAAAWADYDNDGWLDLFVGCEKQPNRLYHSRGDGTFEQVAASAGLESEPNRFCKGCTWIDYDNDGFPDLFVNNIQDTGRLYHNNRDGRFSEVTSAMCIDGPTVGFACWTWDYDNDGWLDLYAACGERSLDEVIKGILGQSHGAVTGRLYRNINGKRFEDKTREAGLDKVFEPMGCNFGDFDNDGWLDMYLGTGDPSLATLIPNRMFKNVAGNRFAEITVSSGTGHLQKGHGVACGDWDRDGDIDLFVQTGGAVDGDKYHNVLFQNPGQGNHWLTVKLVGRKTNRAAIGARIKLVTAGERPATIHRHVSSGSSFGGNPLEQTIGLDKAQRVAALEIQWPTSGTVQVFHDIAADQAVEITEFDNTIRPLNWKRVP
jgi:hypothetical protein